MIIIRLIMIVGPPFGGFMYEYVGKASPFIVLATLGLFDGCKNKFFANNFLSFFQSIVLQLTVLKPGVASEPIEGASLKTLIKDPYILLAAGKAKQLIFLSKLLFDKFRCNFSR